MNDNDDTELQSLQSDLNTDDNTPDPIMQELGEDPSAELGVPPDELKNELDKLEAEQDNQNAVDDDDIDIHDDERENIEGLDEDGDEQVS